MKFKVPPEMEPHIRIRKELPPQYSSYRIPHADTEYVEGGFGSFSTQELTTSLWAIGWLNFFIRHQVLLYPTTRKPMVALYSTLEGDIPCVLEGYGELILQHRKYGFYYVPPEVKNEASFVPGNYEAVYISFAPAFLSQFITLNPQFDDLYTRQQAQVANGQVLPVYPVSDSELDILNKIRYNQFDGVAQKIFLQSRIQDMLVGYFQIDGHGEQASRQEKEAETRVRDTIRYIKQNFHLTLSISSLSQQAKLNLNKYEKTFKALEGIPPRKYIEAVRISEAKRLLSATQLPVSDIAYSVGFANANYFSNVFKKLCHVSPTDYRNGIAR